MTQIPEGDFVPPGRGLRKTKSAQFSAQRNHIELLSFLIEHPVLKDGLSCATAFEESTLFSTSFHPEQRTLDNSRSSITAGTPTTSLLSRLTISIWILRHQTWITKIPNSLLVGLKVWKLYFSPKLSCLLTDIATIVDAQMLL